MPPKRQTVCLFYRVPFSQDPAVFWPPPSQEVATSPVWYFTLETSRWPLDSFLSPSPDTLSAPGPLHTPSEKRPASAPSLYFTGPVLPSALPAVTGDPPPPLSPEGPTNVPGIFLSIPSFVLLLEPHSPTIWSHLQAGLGPQATPRSAQPGDSVLPGDRYEAFVKSLLCPGCSACHLMFGCVCICAPHFAVLDVHTGGTQYLLNK